MAPDIYINIRFRETSEGGRKSPVLGDFYACPLIIDGEAYDCRLFIKGLVLQLGHFYEVPVKFLNRDLVISKLVVGKNITLWEGKEVADGRVSKICFTEQEHGKTD